jgi:DNA-binding transcriptional ArsR family regulator
MTADQLGRSRFGITPAIEILGVIRDRNGRVDPHHARRLERADEVSNTSRALLEALIPHDHPYSPDFLAPSPLKSVETMDEVAERIAATPTDVVEYHLDVAFRARHAPPDLAAAFGGVAALERWRRPMPGVIADLLGSGAPALAAASAEAMAEYFHVVIAPEWTETLDVLLTDVNYRSARMAARGTTALFEDLGDGIRWSDGEIRLERPYQVDVDWADDGVILIPSTVHSTVVGFSAERPLVPVLTYRARGTARLWSAAPPPAQRALIDLLGATRASLLSSLDEPQSTLRLSRSLALAPATVSYHLGILHRASLVQKRPRGQSMLYERTGLGDSLLGR